MKQKYNHDHKQCNHEHNRKRLIKLSQFNTLEDSIQTSEDEILNAIYEEDSRLVPAKATVMQGYSNFGGVYKETNSTAEELNLFAVEFVGYNNINVSGESRTFIGAVATKIGINEETEEISLNLNGRYVSVFQFDLPISKAIAELKDTITFEGLSLDFVGSNFTEAIALLSA